MPPPKILIVDDVPENISVLFEFLISQGFDVSIAPDGESALEVVEHDPPDLILLDVMMPGIDGFETCRRLKAQERSQGIPVIFMTALSDTVDKVRGFQLGAVDYVSKPVQQDEVVGRIRTHVTIRRLQVELERQNAELRAFAHTVAHDLKNPLGIVENAAFMLERDLKGRLEPHDAATLELILKSTRRMQGIIEGLLTLAGLSHQEAIFEPLPMRNLLAHALERLAPLRTEKGAEIQLPDDWPLAFGHPSWVEEVWSNYLSNALKYGGAPPRIEVGAAQAGEVVRFWVQDHGPGLTPGQASRLFVPFTRLHPRQAEGHGLGLSIVQRIVERLGGEAGVDCASGAGCRFWFTLPGHAPG